MLLEAPPHTHCTLRKALCALWMHANLTILTADKGNDSDIHNTSEFNRKFGAFLEEPAWRSLAKDTIETVENGTTLKKLALTDEVSFCLVINHQ